MKELLDKIHEIFEYKVLNMTVGRILYIIFLIVVAVIVSKIVNSILEKIIERAPRISKSLKSFLKPTIKVIVYFVLILIVANLFGINITALLAVFSVVGLAISLSIQNLLSNVFSGVVLLFTKPFDVDDDIEINDVTGKVTRIDLTHTIITTFNGHIVYLQNSDVCSSTITNYSQNTTFRVGIKVTASYDDNIDTVKSALMSAVRRCNILDDPAPYITVSNYGSSSIEYLVRASFEGKSYGEYDAARLDLLEKVKRAFDEAGISMTYDHINVHMVKE